MLRSRRFWVIAVLITAIFLVVVIPFLGAQGVGLTAGKDRVVVIRLDGPIQDGGLGGGIFDAATITPTSVESLLERARVNGAAVIVLRINSPGGSVAASQETLAMIQTFRGETGIPIVISMGDVAASGGYYISAGADKIVANPGTLTGSIGVVWEVLDLEGLYEKIGIEQHTVTSGEHKGAFALGQVDDEARVIIQAMTDEMHAEFIAAVAEGRGLSIEAVRNLATGQPYTGLQAKEVGLVDEIGGLDRAIDIAMDVAEIENATVIEIGAEGFSLFSLPGLRGMAASLQTWLIGPELAILDGVLETRAVPRY